MKFNDLLVQIKHRFTEAISIKAFACDIRRQVYADGLTGSISDKKIIDNELAAHQCFLCLESWGCCHHCTGCPSTLTIWHFRHVDNLIFGQVTKSNSLIISSNVLK